MAAHPNAMPPIRALIFDFDGLILDTETPAFESWRAIYAEYGHDLPFEQWQAVLGRGIAEGFDPAAYLAALVTTQPFDQAAIWAQRQARKQLMCEELTLLPGVLSMLDQADQIGLPCAVASSSGRAWVENWLRRHAIYDRFVCVRTADDVAATKPAPDLFLSAAACLNVDPSACLVFEDSPNGLLAAKAAGMRCIAVPCAVTARLTLPPADLVLTSLADQSLTDLLQKVSSRGG